MILEGVMAHAQVLVQEPKRWIANLEMRPATRH
jgi:hypothetical protein